MKAVFISDAHLKYAGDERYGRLIRFLNDLQCGKARSLVHDRELGRDAAPIDDLYILGDFLISGFAGLKTFTPNFKRSSVNWLNCRPAVSASICAKDNHDFS